MTLRLPDTGAQTLPDGRRVGPSAFIPIAERTGFYDRCLFHTTVEQTTWNDNTGRWTVRTDRGDAMRARVVVLANGILTTPKLARIAGILAEHAISIDALLQRPNDGSTSAAGAAAHTDVIILTHDTVEGNMNRAIAQMQALPTVLAPIVRIRKEELS